MATLKESDIKNSHLQQNQQQQVIQTAVTGITTPRRGDVLHYSQRDKDGDSEKSENSEELRPLSKMASLEEGDNNKNSCLHHNKQTMEVAVKGDTTSSRCDILKYNPNDSGSNSVNCENSEELNDIIIQPQASRVTNFGRSLRNSNRVNNHLQNAIITTTTKYTINQGKALKKKHEHCHRDDPFNVTITSGGITISCQTGLFEILKHCMVQYYSRLKSIDIKPVFHIMKDETNHEVQITIKLTKIGSNRTSYTVNIYNTSSSLLINGNGSRKFFNTDMPHMLKSIGEGLVSPAAANNTIKDMLMQLMSKVNTSKNCYDEKDILPAPAQSKATCLMPQGTEPTTSQHSDLSSNSLPSESQHVVETQHSEVNDSPPIELQHVVETQHIDVSDSPPSESQHVVETQHSDVNDSPPSESQHIVETQHIDVNDSSPSESQHVVETQHSDVNDSPQVSPSMWLKPNM